MQCHITSLNAFIFLLLSYAFLYCVILLAIVCVDHIANHFV